MLQRMPSVIKPSLQSRRSKLTLNDCNQFWWIWCSSRRGVDACNIGWPAPAR